MPRFYTIREYSEAKREAVRLLSAYRELVKHLDGFRRFRYSRQEISDMEHRAFLIRHRYNKLARRLGFKPLAIRFRRLVKKPIKVNTAQCQTCGKFDGAGGISCPNCPGLPSYGKSPTKISAEKGDWKAPDGTIISDTGSNEVNNKFDTSAKAIDHANKHIDRHYSGLTMAEYTEKAARLASSPVGGNIHGFSRNVEGREPDVVRWDRATGDFVIAVPGKNGFIRTMYNIVNKSGRGLAYFDDRKKAQWKFRKGRR